MSCSASSSVNVIGALITGFEVGAPALPATSAAVDATLNKICADRMAEGEKRGAISETKIRGGTFLTAPMCRDVRP